jgi:hypothetical protein
LKSFHGLGLDLDLNNWQSRIRSTVRDHGDYAGIEDYPISKETADIIFDDCDGKFTALMIDGGYLPSELWQGRSPTYWIEVKTTTSRCETPFIVGPDQFDFMEAKRLPGVGVSDEVLLLVRVYKLGQAGMGLKLYLDPRKSGNGCELSFHADEYKVVPHDRQTHSSLFDLGAKLWSK